MTRFRPGRRRLAAVLAILTVFAGLALTQPAAAVQETTTSRIAGGNRYETAADAALAAFPAGAANVVLATGAGFVDALSASGLAGALDAPVLLTGPNKIHAAAADALQKLNATTVYLMGGDKAISADVATALTSAGYTVVRVAGDDRYGTAGAAGDLIADNGGIGDTGNGATALLANAREFPDAVSASPVAFAGRLPVLVTEQATLHPTTLAALDRLAIAHVIILGGPDVVSSAVENAITGSGRTVQRLAGTNRYGTNVAIAGFAQDELGFGGPEAVLATGEDYPDALAGGSTYAGKRESVLLLTPEAALGGRPKQFLIDNAAPYDEIVALGGTDVISAAVLAAAADAAHLISPQSYDVSPATAAALQPSSGGLNSDDAGVRTYTVTGLDPSTGYVIALLNADTVDTDASTFTSYSVSNDAASTVNGASPQVTATSTADGTLEFTIDATAHDSVVPVVYLDENANGELDLVDGDAIEPFGLGGRTTWIPAEAPDGKYLGSSPFPIDDPDSFDVTSLDRDANFFVGPAGTFHYATGDVFEIVDAADAGNVKTISFNAFEDALTVGDHIETEYYAAKQSLFRITDDVQSGIDSVVAATISTVPGTTNDKVTLTWTPTDQPDVVYHVYRDEGRNARGTLDAAITGDTELTTASGTTATTFTFVETVKGTTQYIVRPYGGSSNQEYYVAGTDSFLQPTYTYFVSNEVRVGDGFIGLTEGSELDLNDGLSAANEGDVWLLHFSHDVTVAANASITVKGQTYTNNTSRSTWTVNGSTVTITLGSGANTTTFAYPGTITSLSGVSDLAGSAFALGNLRDTTIGPDVAPELMLESSTCNVGDDECTLAFNQGVSADASDPANYTLTSASATISDITLGADGRTITISFNGTIGAGDTIRPVGPGIGANVDGSTQAAIAFVIPA